jgi:hypothetical protein
MSYQQFQTQWKSLSELIDNLPEIDNEHMNSLVKSYVAQNLVLLNEVFATSIDNLKRLQKVKSANDIICTQAKFTSEISKKISLSTQRFLNTSLGQFTNYNEWLKTHCDLATE